MMQPGRSAGNLPAQDECQWLARTVRGLPPFTDRDMKNMHSHSSENVSGQGLDELHHNCISLASLGFFVFLI